MPYGATLVISLLITNLLSPLPLQVEVKVLGFRVWGSGFLGHL